MEWDEMKVSFLNLRSIGPNVGCVTIACVTIANLQTNHLQVSPFGHGPRMCIGNYMNLRVSLHVVDIKVILFLRKYYIFIAL